MLGRNHIIHAHQHHCGLDNARQPVLEVLPGETLTLETVDASGGQLSASSSAEDVRALDFSRVNPVTGPVRVLGAEPGDALQVELLEFKPGGWGWTANIPGFGLLNEDFPDAHLKTWTFGEGKTATFADGIEVPLKAFPGTIGVAPAENGLYSVVPPRGAGRRRGMPHRYRITDGGDGAVRARQGCRSAPQFETPSPVTRHHDSKGYYITTGVGPDLLTAAKDAVAAMIEHLGKRYDLTPEDAYLLCSVACDLRISEVVDLPNWVVSFYLPLQIFS